MNFLLNGMLVIEWNLMIEYYLFLIELPKEKEE